MKKGMIAALLLFALCISVFGCSSKQQAQPLQKEQPDLMAATSVEIKDYSFILPEVKVKNGTKVSWVNKDMVQHTVTFDDKSQGDFTLNYGEIASKIFDRPGTYSYHCSIHPNMKGKVIVQP